jgi:hypothetical protein
MISHQPHWVVEFTRILFRGHYRIKVSKDTDGDSLSNCLLEVRIPVGEGKVDMNGSSADVTEYGETLFIPVEYVREHCAENDDDENVRDISDIREAFG